MRLHEISSPRFYHGSHREFPIGFVLTPQSEGYVLGFGMDAIERKAHQYCETKLEEYRPSTAIPRKGAVYMVKNPSEVIRAGGYGEFVYAVEPIGPVSCCNLYWYSQLEGLGYNIEEVDENDVRNMAKSYWAAATNDLDEPNRDLFEYLAGSAKIIDLIQSS